MPKIYQLLTDEIEEFVLQYINEHQLKPHDKLPTERELSTSLNVNRITLRNGLQKLIQEFPATRLQLVNNSIAESIYKFTDRGCCKDIYKENIIMFTDFFLMKSMQY